MCIGSDNIGWWFFTLRNPKHASGLLHVWLPKSAGLNQLSAYANLFGEMLSEKLVNTGAL